MNPYDKIADELEQHPEQWTRGEFARNAKGESVHPCDLAAVSWCAGGLCIRDGCSSAILDVILWAKRKVRTEQYNDARGRRVEHIIKLFRAAAKWWAA